LLNRTSQTSMFPSVRFIAAISIGVVLLTVQTPGIAQAPEERGIYEAVLKMLLGRSLPSALVMQTPPLVLPHMSASEWRILDPDTSSTLQTKVEAARSAPTDSFSGGSFPPGTQLVPKEQIEELFRTAPSGNSPESSWLPFRSRFNVSSFQAVSRPIITDDGLNALVYYSHSCGLLCGETGYAVLYRSSLSEVWVVARRLRKSIS
jgi:hypothetical protein